MWAGGKGGGGGFEWIRKFGLGRKNQIRNGLKFSSEFMGVRLTTLMCSNQGVPIAKLIQKNLISENHWHIRVPYCCFKTTNLKGQFVIWRLELPFPVTITLVNYLVAVCWDTI